jgi:hypothetical protein
MPETKHDTFKLWATSDAHVVREASGEGFDPARVPRESLRSAIEQVEGKDGFDYDIAFHLGDMLDYDYETLENFQLYREQLAHSKKDPHYWYHLGGNNDENSVLNDGVAIDNEYYRKVIDPAGEFTETSGIDNQRRPFPVDGTYERYSFDVGNMRFLFLSDRNDLPAPYGRGEGGFYVDGAITLESFRWLVRQIVTWPERILVVACHHPLKETTIATCIDDSWKGRYMTPYKPEKALNPTQRMQGVLHQIYPIAEFDTPLFHYLMSQNEGAVDMWLSGHIHHRVDETFGGRGKYARAYGGHHLNIGNLCRFRHFANIISAQSNLFSWQQGSNVVESRVFVHDHPSIPAGFYAPEDRSLKLKTAFSDTATQPTVTPPQTEIEIRCTAADAEGHLQLEWQGDCTGLLVVATDSAQAAFTPQDDTVYYAGESVDNAEVLFIGTSRNTVIPAPATSAATHLHAFAYNAGGGTIHYQEEPAIKRF